MALGAACLTAGTALVGVPAAAAPEQPHGSALLPWSEAKARPVLRRGDSGIWVGHLHAALDLETSGAVFRRKTARAVKAFRADHGLRVRPVVNARTWRHLGTAPAAGPAAVPPAIGFGATSAWIQAVQLAVGVQPASGYFGPLTQQAIADFQGRNGLPQTGEVDPVTWALLAPLVSAPPPDPTMTPESQTSRDHRASIGLAAFSTSWSAQFVADRESRGQCDAVSAGGTWRGKWQMDATFWQYYGGLALAPTPDTATCEQQDEIAYRGWVDRWWQPWRTDAFP